MKRIVTIVLAVLCMLPHITGVNADSGIDLTQYEVFQTALIKKMGGDVKGFGMLAKYEASPKSIYIKRVAANYTNPFYDEAIVRVFDPDGFLQARINIPDEAVFETELNIPEGKAGIWRISVSGGNNGDNVTLGLPGTDIWGIRGEMALGMTEDTLHEGYIYMAKTTNLEDRTNWHNNVLPSGYLFGEAVGSSTEITVSDLNGNFICKTEANGKRKNFMLDPVPEGDVLKINISGNGGYAAFDGTPGLICPTIEAARQLKGGTVTVSNGFCFAGPLQAKIYEKMVQMLEEKSFDCTFDWPESISENADLMHEVLFVGKYSPISDIELRIENQVMDKDNPCFGQILEEDGSRWSSAGGLATAFTKYGELNPAYQNEELLNRAVLNCLSEVVYTQGDGIVRNKTTFQDTGYPFSGFFFLYEEHLTGAYLILESYLDEETKTLWREMMLDIGDKAAYVRCYQSNQWAFMMEGHLNVYLATGEERFLNYFKAQMVAYLDNGYGPSAKLGQHPAGYFLEEYGPDGNYQSLNLYVLVNCFNKYKQVSETDELYMKMKSGIENALYFNSFYWLKQPNGSISGPTHMNGRTTSYMGSPSYPGDYMAKSEFPLAYRRWLMNEQTNSKSGFSGSSSVNNGEWAKYVIESLISENGRTDYDKWNMFPFVGLFEAYAQQQLAKSTSIPTDSNDSLWTLPGQNAWKKGELYGMVFYDVAGSSYKIPKSIFGGAPSVLWSEGTGITLCSFSNDNENNAVLEENHLTFSCVYKYNGDEILTTGRTHPEYSGAADNFTVTETFGGDNVSWKYDISDECTQITVSYDGEDAAYLNLPFYNHSNNLNMKLSDSNTFVVSYGESVMEFKGVNGAVLSEDISVNTKKIKRLTIPLNEKITITVKAYDTGYIRHDDYILKYNFNDTASLDGHSIAGIPEIEDGWLKVSYNPYVTDENGNAVSKNHSGRCYNKVKIDVTGKVRVAGCFMFEDGNAYIPKRNLLSFGKNGTYESPVSYGLSTGTSDNLYFYGNIICKVKEKEKYYLEYVVDFDKKTCDGYLNGKHIGTHSLRQDIDGIDTLRYIDSFASTFGEHINYADNVSVCYVTERSTYNGAFTVRSMDFYKGESRAVLLSEADSVKLSVYNMQDSSKDINVCIGMYAEGVLKNIVYAPYTAKQYETIAIDEKITVPAGIDELVCYLWDKESQQPYISKYNLD